MDHLKTDQERKDRWYARNIVPEYVAVRSVDLEVMRQGIERCSNLKSSGDISGIPSSLLITHGEETQQYLRSHLRIYGFAVIQNVLKESECNHALSLAWDYLEAASVAEQKFQESNSNQTHDTHININTPPPVRRGERETYKSQYFPRSVEGMIFPFYGSGHSSFMWYLRSHPQVQSVFAALHSVKSSNELISSSLDGFILWTDMDQDDDLDRGWFHIDQSPEKKPDFASFQGLVNLLPVTAKTGGNVLVVGSHRLFPEHYLQSNKTYGLFYKERLKEMDGDDWLEIDPNDELLQSERVITCLLDPGDVLIWDSRTVHCSYREELESEQTSSTGLDSQHGLVRAAGLVNMIPRIDIPAEVHSERLCAVSRSRTLTHWVNKAAPLGEEREEEVRKEHCCVGYMKENVQNVLLSYEDLRDVQRNLI